MVYFLCKAYDSDRQNCYFARSLPVRGAWIEIFGRTDDLLVVAGRSPCGERGLKFPHLAGNDKNASRSPCGERGLKLDLLRRWPTRSRSLPVRGAWIEIGSWRILSSCPRCRSPCGERGLKLWRTEHRQNLSCRSPCGERGLKLPTTYIIHRLA